MGIITQLCYNIYGEIMNNWILLTILYAVFTSFYECSRKKAVQNNTIYEVLALFTTIAFLLVIPFAKGAFSISYNYLLIILVKSLIIVLAWILGLKAMKEMQLSIYSILKISTIIFSVMLSHIVLNESITIATIVGIIIAIIGLVLVNKTTDNGDKKNNELKIIIILLISCFLNSVSSILDKVILLHINSGQLQFWFLFFLMIFYWLILLSKNEKISINKMSKNYWIFMSAVFLVVGDRMLFKANEIVSSKVIIMTMLKQFSVIVSVLLGKLFFNEKDIIKKMLYSVLIILGVLIMLAF